MKIKILIPTVVLFFMSTYINAQRSSAQIENYSKAYSKAISVKKEANSKEMQSSVVEVEKVKDTSSNLKSAKQNQDITKNNSTEEINVLSSPTKLILFKESFSNKTLDNIWLENSDTRNMMGFDTPSDGKVLKICNNHIQTSMIEYYLVSVYKVGSFAKGTCRKIFFLVFIFHNSVLFLLFQSFLFHFYLHDHF